MRVGNRAYRWVLLAVLPLVGFFASLFWLTHPWDLFLVVLLVYISISFLYRQLALAEQKSGLVERQSEEVFQDTIAPGWAEEVGISKAEFAIRSQSRL